MYLKLLFQKWLCFCCLIIIYPTLWVFLFVYQRYKVRNLKYIRKRFKAIRQKLPGSLIICPNHLTYIDSVILLFVFGSFWDYLFNFNTFMWNFPKIDHIKNNFLYKAICYLGKCIFIDFSAQTINTKLVLQKAACLLSHKEYILIFPEGHRSTTGKIDVNNFAYGVGKLVAETPNTGILCVYLRGDSQTISSNFPKKQENFYCKTKMIKRDNLLNNRIINSKNSLRIYRDISKNIINNLNNMEQQYFLKYFVQHD